MQYKIPIQIENEDSIILGLSLRQLGIIIVGVMIAYFIFNKFDGQSNTFLLIICGIIIFIFVVIAKFKNHEMTFFPFILNFVRLKVNGWQRQWKRSVDSHSALSTGYIRVSSQPHKKTSRSTSTKMVDFESNIAKL